MLFLFGGIMVCSSFSDFIVSFKPAVSFGDMLEGEEVKAGTHVNGDVVYVLDYFASQTTYTKYSDGSRSGSRKSGNYYLIPTADGFIGLKSRQADVAALNQLSEETFEFISSGTEPSTAIAIEGAVKPMETDIAQYYKDYLAELGYTEEEIEAFGEPLVIQIRNFLAVRIIMLLGILLLVLAFVILVRSYKRAVRGSGLPKAEDLPNAPI